MSYENYKINPHGKYTAPMKRTKENVKAGDIRDKIKEIEFKKELARIELQSREVG